MHYRVTEVEPEKYYRVALVDSPMFKNADWYFELEPAPQGTRIVCRATFNLRPRYLFLAPVLFLNTRAIKRDLLQLKQVLESPEVEGSH